VSKICCQETFSNRADLIPLSDTADKGLVKNNLVEFALKFAVDLIDLIEQNRRNSELFRGLLRMKIGLRYGEVGMRPYMPFADRARSSAKHLRILSVTGISVLISVVLPDHISQQIGIKNHDWFLSISRA
jgi:hypothetical protein